MGIEGSNYWNSVSKSSGTISFNISMLCWSLTFSYCHASPSEKNQAKKKNVVFKGTRLCRLNKLPVCLEQVKRTCSDWTCCWFYKVTFLDTVTISCFTSWLPFYALFFSSLHFDSGWNTRRSPLCVQVTEEMHVDCNNFVSDCFLISVEWTFEYILQRSRNKICPWEKLWSVNIFLHVLCSCV